MSPKRVADQVGVYDELLNNYPVEIHHHSYEEITPKQSDVVYLDPPYENTKSMYNVGFDSPKFLDWVNTSLNGTYWLMSYNGSVDGKDTPHKEPVYREKYMLYSGQSSFRKVLNENPDMRVHESLYVGGVGDEHPLPDVVFWS